MTRTDALKALLVTAVTATLVAFSAPEARAHHLPNMHCSESGDICQTVGRIDGVRKLRIDLAARYFGRYILCLKGPGPVHTCDTFRIEERKDGTFGDSINFRRRFGAEPGRYVVTWYRYTPGPPTEQIGRKLGFHVR